uniref:Major facilitator superfamily (MFS) profile domain-containing protein n=1 Tax=Naja naja TaxID=35670 RepID=A0A8C6Y4C2_NAJNA
MVNVELGLWQSSLSAFLSLLLQHIKAFYNATWYQRYGHGLPQGPLTLMYSLTVSIFALGGFVGTFPVGILVTQYGRNGTLIRSNFLVLLAGMLMGFSRYLGSPEMVILGRICLSVVPMYLGEIAPKNLRGFLGLVPCIFICLGVFSAQVLGLPEVLGEDAYWPLFLSVVVVPAFLQLLLLNWFPESPRYLLIEKNNVHGAAEALSLFLGQHNVQDTIAEIEEEKRSLASVKAVSVWQLLSDHSVRLQVLSVVVINMGMQLSGIDAIWFYTNAIFENAGIPDPDIPYTTVGTGAIEVVAGLIGVSVGSKGRTLTNLLGTECSLSLTAGVPFLMTAELFKQSHRPSAYIVGGSLNWLSNFTVGFVFPFFKDSIFPNLALQISLSLLGITRAQSSSVTEKRICNKTELVMAIIPEHPISRAGKRLLSPCDSQTVVIISIIDTKRDGLII